MLREIGRRGFLKTLGAAVLGTAIALELPEILIPTPHLEKEKAPESSFSSSYLNSQPFWSSNEASIGAITYEMLERTYMECMKGSAESNYIVIGNVKIYNFLRDRYGTESVSLV